VVGPLSVASLPWLQLPGWAFDAPTHVVQHGVDALVGAKAKPEVLLTHAPPFGTLDFLEKYGNVGNKHYVGLAERLGAQVHAFGHIHECGSQRQRVGSVTHVNAAVLQRDYATVIQPGMVERIKVGA
jgi:Icc-related predicted phosphoesterase